MIKKKTDENFSEKSARRGTLLKKKKRESTISSKSFHLSYFCRAKIPRATMDSRGKNETWPSPASLFRAQLHPPCARRGMSKRDEEREREGRGAGRASSHNKSPLAGEIRRTCVLPNYRALPPSLPPFSRKTGHWILYRPPN